MDAHMEQLQYMLHQRQDANAVLFDRTGVPSLDVDNKTANEADILGKVQRNIYMQKEVQDAFGGRTRAAILEHFDPEKISASRENSNMMDIIFENRKKNYQNTTDHLQGNILELNQQRFDILEEHRRTRDFRKRHPPIASPPFTPFGGRPTLSSSGSRTDSRDTTLTCLSPNAFIERTNANLPSDIERYHIFRQNFMKEQENLWKPYSGELGPQSYHTWQLKDYSMVRSIVEEIVDDFLDLYFRKLPPAINKETAQALLDADLQEWQRKKEAQSQHRAIQLIMEELVLEVTSEMVQYTVTEFTVVQEAFKSRTDQSFIRNAEAVATGHDQGRPADDPAHHLVHHVLGTLQKDRDSQRKDIWSHTQPLFTLAGFEDTEDSDDTDVTTLTFHQVTPCHMRQLEPGKKDTREVVRWKEAYIRYHRMEVEYWMQISLGTEETIILAKKCLSITICRLSPSHKLLAVGTSHGDIIIYDVSYTPFRPIRVIHNQGREHDSILDITWSLDGSQLISIKEGGALQLWSMGGGSIRKSDVKGVEAKLDKSGFMPSQLTQELCLDVDALDFQFQTGQLADSAANANISFPSVSIFSPSLNFFGKQESFCVALDSGDVLQCDYAASRGTADVDEEGIPILPAPRVFSSNMNTANPNSNFIGQGIEANLLRKHKYEVVLMGFIRNTGDLVTVDHKGYINIWRITQENSSGSGWMKPSGMYKLDMSKMMYSPTSNVKPNVLFNERKKSERSTRTRQQTERQRRKAQAIIDSLGLSDPWHEEYLPDMDLMTSVYPPIEEEVADSGGLFHVIVRCQSSGQLISYLTRIYKPHKVKASCMVSCHISPAGTELVFLLLFPLFPPKGPHFTVVIVDLPTMKIRDFRLDIPINEDEYEECLHNSTVSSCISRQYGPTGASYIFINNHGSLSAYSLVTGNQVLQSDSPHIDFSGFIGSRLRIKSLHPAGGLQVACVNNQMTILSHTSDQAVKKGLTQLYTISLQDNNLDEDRRRMYKAFQLWDKHPDLVSTQLRLNVVDYMVDDLLHPQTEIMDVVLECMDAAIQTKDGLYSQEEAEAYKDIDQVRKYDALLAEFEAKRVMTGSKPPSRVTASRPFPGSSVSAVKPFPGTSVSGVKPFPVTPASKMKPPPSRV